jgi:hypothetical protein
MIGERLTARYRAPNITEDMSSFVESLTSDLSRDQKGIRTVIANISNTATGLKGYYKNTTASTLSGTTGYFQNFVSYTGYFRNINSNNETINNLIVGNIQTTKMVVLTGTNTYDIGMMAQGIKGTSEPSGFEEDSKPVLRISTSQEGNPVIQLLPYNFRPSFNVWINGQKYIKTSDGIELVSFLDGEYYLYYDQSCVLSCKSTPFVWNNDIPVSTFYVQNNTIIYLCYELHGNVMDWTTVEFLRSTYGMKYVSGFPITYTLGTQSISLGSGLSYESDIQINTSQLPFSLQQLSPIAKIPIYYKVGNGTVYCSTATNYPVIQTAGHRIMCNYYNSGTWYFEESYENYFVPVYIYAGNSILNSVVGFLDVDYSALDQVLPATNFTPRLDNVKLVLLFRLIYQTSSSYPDPKCNLVQVDDYRTTPIVDSPFVPAVSHSSLAGLGNSDHPASSIYADVPSYTSILGTSSLQEVLNSYNTLFSIMTGTTFTETNTIYCSSGMNTSNIYANIITGVNQIYAYTGYFQNISGTTASFNELTLESAQCRDLVGGTYRTKNVSVTGYTVIDLGNILYPSKDTGTNFYDIIYNLVGSEGDLPKSANRVDTISDDMKYSSWNNTIYGGEESWLDTPAYRVSLNCMRTFICPLAGSSLFPLTYAIPSKNGKLWVGLLSSSSSIGAGIWISNDYGITYNKIVSYQTPSSQYHLHVAGISPNNNVIIVGTTANIGISPTNLPYWISTDGGNTFTMYSSTIYFQGSLLVKMSYDGSTIFLPILNSTALISRDGGLTFVDAGVNCPSPCNNVGISGDGQIIHIGNLVSTNNGNTWRNRPCPIIPTSVDCDMTGRKVLSLIYGNGSMYYSQNGTASFPTWKSLDSNGTKPNCSNCILTYDGMKAITINPTVSNPIPAISYRKFSFETLPTIISKSYVSSNGISGATGYFGSIMTSELSVGNFTNYDSMYITANTSPIDFKGKGTTIFVATANVLMYLKDGIVGKTYRIYNKSSSTLTIVPWGGVTINSSQNPVVLRPILSNLRLSMIELTEVSSSVYKAIMNF